MARGRRGAGRGRLLVDGGDVKEDCRRDVDQLDVRKPLEATESIDRYDIAAKIHGGGTTGQAGALRHGIARALEKLDRALEILRDR